MKVFLDANIFFAAAGSLTGGSSLVLELGKSGMFEVVTVSYALLEAERNIKNKLDEKALERHYQNLLDLSPSIQPLEHVKAHTYSYFEKLIRMKDAPILLGAILSRSDFLVTLDKQDFLENDKLKTLRLPFQILPPGDFLAQVVK